MHTTTSFHHIEIHTIQPNYILDLFVQVYGFQLIGQRQTPAYQQWFLKSVKCQLIISSVVTEFNFDQLHQSKSDQHYDILSSILMNPVTRNLIVKRDTVFNVTLEVKSIRSILNRQSYLEILVEPCHATDEYGTIEYACIKSCIGNVVHTLIDTSKYTGSCLPGFNIVSTSKDQLSNGPIVCDIDHVAFAVERDSALSTVTWYENSMLGVKRFFVNREDDPFQGFTVRVGDRGMRLFASEYWKCSETACVDNGSSSIKFVFSESLLETNTSVKDQITTFIQQHNHQAGIQHLGFTCNVDIKNAVRATKNRGAQYLTPMPKYYLKENNGRIIEAAGENAIELADLGILLDDEADCQSDQKKILLQIFTKSIFNNDTFFLELIERRGACGFGGGNIRTLWKIVQNQMDSHQ